MTKKESGKPCKNAPHCDGLVGPRSKLKECVNCRARLLTWLKRPIIDILRYATELKKRTARMDEVSDDRGIEYKPTYRASGRRIRR